MDTYRWIGAVLCAAVIVAVSCATPSSPTGGPPDKEGPAIIRTEPETGKTNFSGRTITLHFSEFVNRGSLDKAIVVEPDIGIRYKLDWGRKSVEIVFDRAIPDSTTLIVTIGTEFKDVNGNKMAKPQKVAVSTGPVIDDGSLVGKILNAKTGKGEEGNRILLYRDPVDLDKKADYIASTDTSGNFQFSYLSQGRYKAFWVEDRNRNKKWDRESERAQPFAREFVTLEKSATDTLGTVYRTPVDTTKPALQGIGLFSSRRLRMRFSENIKLTDSVAITITDTTGSPMWDAYPLYIQPGERFVLFGQSKQPLGPDSFYGMDIRGIVDSFGNELKNVTQTFSGSAQKDTTQQRIIGRNNLSGYYPEEPVVITYARPITESAIKDSLKIVAGDTLLKSWPGTQIHRNKLIINPDKQWKDGLSYEFRVWDPIIESHRKLQPEIWHSSRMGALALALRDSSGKIVRVEITNEEAGVARNASLTDSVEVEQLPPLNYRVSAYRDINGNKKWDFGRVAPYEAPEPYFIQQKVPVKKAMTGELTIILE